MSKLKEQLLKNGKIKNASSLKESEYFNDVDIIPTELPMLNIALSGRLDGGLTSFLTILSGDSKSLKCLGGETKLVVYVDE